MKELLKSVLYCLFEGIFMALLIANLLLLSTVLWGPFPWGLF